MNSPIQVKRIASTLFVATTLLLVRSAFSAPPDKNTRFGVGALPDNSTCKNSSAFGYKVLGSGPSGDNNTATGSQAMLNNSTGDGNVANGNNALLTNTTGHSNTAVGGFVMESNSTGGSNTAIGYSALRFNNTGRDNVAVGDGAATSLKTASRNTVIGSRAVFRLLPSDVGNDNIAVGFRAGVNLGPSSNFNIEIGSEGVTGDTNTIRVGDSNQTLTFVAGISGVAVSGAGVVVNASGQLGVAASSARFKNNISPMDKASDAILGLKPVSFRYNKDIDPAGTSQFGLVAEDVEKVNPDLVVHDKEGKPYTVRYDAVNAMLLNEFLKEHHTVQEQGQELQKQAATIAKQQKQIEALAAGLEKVSAHFELDKPAAQTAFNNQ